MGYAVIQRKWKKGDKVELALEMNIRLVAGNSKIEDTHGKVVMMRGPLVYCVEETDNKRCFEGENDLYLLSSGLKAKYRKDLLDGVVTINGTASSTSTLEKIDITAIPYYAWSNREIGKMRVWMPFTEND
jgi:hypothetical protein